MFTDGYQVIVEDPATEGNLPSFVDRQVDGGEKLRAFAKTFQARVLIGVVSILLLLVGQYCMTSAMVDRRIGVIRQEMRLESNAAVEQGFQAVRGEMEQEFRAME